MKFINLETWERKEHFEFFKGFDYPNYSVSANVELTNFYNYVKSENLPFFASLVFVAIETINRLPNFKLRIRGNQVVEHEIIHPIFTVMTPNKLFNFCRSEYITDYNAFIEHTLKVTEISKNGALSISNGENVDDCIYITSLPWVSFTQVVHPIFMNPANSVPIITWGKYFEENNKLMLPLSVQAHHGLIDGIHMAEFFELFQELLNDFAKMHRSIKQVA